MAISAEAHFTIHFTIPFTLCSPWPHLEASKRHQFHPAKPARNAQSLPQQCAESLTIELRIAPPSETEEDDADETVDESEAEIYDQLLETQNQLIFPEPSDDPILGIPKLKDDEG